MTSASPDRVLEGHTLPVLGLNCVIQGGSITDYCPCALPSDGV